MRVSLQNDLSAKEFSELLIDIGNGNITEQEGKITIPNNLCDIVGDLIPVIDKIYPSIEYATLNSLSWWKERAIPTPTNESADKINEFILEKLTTELMNYETIDTVIEEGDTVF
ncbi:ATP-dependent DNA helicase [Nephila pilipes]|uniref:ATP-dependent DNA helicase n=1 Tax=Nephila pilipes TaxID=299642 RepID=A0A8X6MVY8_NEPPI|nr:ATP-dependent DNA helicase [Nephila pilipes]